MKKTILAATLIFLSISGFNAAAQNSKATDSKAKTECPANCDCDRNKARKDKAHKDRKDKGDKALRAFRGIDLNADQKAKIEALNAENKARRQAAKAANADKKKGELTDAQRQQMKADKKKAKDAYVASVKSILTPDQFAQFEKNMQHSKAKSHDKRDKAHGKKGDNRRSRS